MPNIFEKIYFKYKTRTLKDFIFYKFRINNLFRFLKKIIFGKNIKKWFKDNGDENLRFNYQFSKNDVIFELGAYTGQDLTKFVSLFDCYIYAFEPSKKYFQILINKFQNSDVKIFNYGISDQNTIEYLVHKNDGSFITKKAKNLKNSETITVKKLSWFIDDHAIKKINLINMNIEGSEYKVLNEIILSGKISIVDTLQIQFHRKTFLYFIKKSYLTYKLKKTHKLIWKYNYVWERWDKK